MRPLIGSPTKVLIAFWASLLLALALPLWYFHRTIEGAIVAESRRIAAERFTPVYWFFSRQGGFRDAEHLQSWLVDLAAHAGGRITYIADGGTVIADSAVPFADLSGMDNHAHRPEVLEARSAPVGMSTRYSNTLQMDTIYVAKAVQRTGAIPSGTLRLAVPAMHFQHRYDRLSTNLFVCIGISCALVIALSFLLTRLLYRPLADLVRASQAIGRRDYRTRVPLHPRHDLYPLARSINQMAESIEAHIDTVTDQKRQLEAILDGMQEGVIALDGEGKVRGVNRAMVRILPEVNQPLGRRPLEMTMNLELQSACDRVLAGTDTDGGSPHSLQITLPNGRSYDVTIVRVQAPQGPHHIGAIIVLHDISEVKRLERVRQDFVANVSHELRTPLTSIKGYAETMLADTRHLPPLLAQFLQIILKNTDHMTKMVEDLLQLAKLEARKPPATPPPANAPDAIQEAWKACAPLARDKDVTLVNQLPSGEHLVQADFDQLVQVFRNLLENAIRYAPPRTSITVSAAVDEGTITFQVRDEGPGILKRHHERIFERFYRVESHRGHSEGGTGLGLAICRHIVQNSGGRIWVQSPNEQDVKGSTFFFTLLRACGETRGTGNRAPGDGNPRAQTNG